MSSSDKQERNNRIYFRFLIEGKVGSKHMKLGSRILGACCVGGRHLYCPPLAFVLNPNINLKNKLVEQVFLVNAHLN